MVAEGEITFVLALDGVRRGVGASRIGGTDIHRVQEDACCLKRSITVLTRKSMTQWEGNTYAGALGWNRKLIQ